MQKTIKVFTLFLFIILLSVLSTACQDTNNDERYEGFIFSKKGNEYAITQYIGKTEAHIPDTYMDLPITSISEAAFYSSSVRRVYVGENIKTIAKNAFTNCQDLIYVFISKSVTSIGDNIFSNCLSLYEIEVDEENTRFQNIDGNLYSKDGSSFIAYCSGKGDEELSVYEGVESLRSYLFYENPYIKELHLPSTLTQIGEMAFYNTAIENFYIDENNQTFSTIDGILYKDEIILYAFPASKEMQEFVLPDQIRTIYDDAFNHSQVSEITINQGAIEIGDRAFFASALKDIYIPASINKIGETAFAECNDLINITVNNQNQHFQDIAGDALLSANSKEMLAYCLGLSSTSYTIPTGVEKIHSAVFFSSLYLEEIVLPSSITDIGAHALSAPFLSAVVFNSYLPPQIEHNSISGSSLIIYVPNQRADTYKNYNDLWNYYADSIMEISQR